MREKRETEYWLAACRLRVAVLLLVVLTAATAWAQQTDDWQEVYLSMFSINDEEETEWEELCDLLQPLAEHPMDLNQATREELQQLPFLSEQQVSDLLEYLEEARPMRSWMELKMIPSFDWAQQRLLPYFAYISEDSQEAAPTAYTKDRHDLTLTARVPFYKRKGDQNGYMGYRYRHWLKYEYTHDTYLRIGLVGTQDSGEPFMANRNRWGYDTYSYFLQLKQRGRLDNLVIGKYKMATGLGLVMGQSFSLGKMMTLQNMGRQQQTLRPHYSRSAADYFQGAAATLRLSRPLRLTLAASYRPTDATLNDDGTAATLITSGYHRTESEMAKKDNTRMTSGAAALSFRQWGVHAGLNIIYTHLNRSLEPNRQTLYRQHYAHGTNFVNASINYGWHHHLLSVNGETAIDGHGHLATLNAVAVSPTTRLTIMALQRFYSYRYTSLHGHSMSDAGRVQNESGIYLGLRYTPWRHWSLQGYVDYAYHPWARYLVSQSSHNWDLLLQATYQRQHWTVEGRYRGRLRQRDNEDKTMLTANNTHRGRLTVTYTPNDTWTAKTLLNVSHNFCQKASNGWLVAQNMGYQQQKLKAQLTAAYFDTDSYDSRIYAYERQLAGNFAYPVYYGQGFRLALSGAWHLNRHLMVAAKVGFTKYFDRNTIGTGLQEIAASHATDLDVQMRWRL